MLDYETDDRDNIIKNEQVCINLYPNKYAPYKKVSKHKLTFKSKPWIITTGIQKPISLKKNTIQIHKTEIW